MTTPKKTPNPAVRLLQAMRGRRLRRYIGNQPKAIDQKVREYYQSHQADRYFSTLESRDIWQDMCRRKSFLELCREANNIVDLGCGAGDLPVAISTHLPHKRIWAIDLGEYAGRLISPDHNNIDFRRMDAINPQLPPEFADLVISRFFIEHTIYPEQLIQQIYRILKPKGFIYLLYAQLIFKVMPGTALREMFSWLTRSKMPLYLDPQIDEETYISDDSDAVWLSNPIKIRRMMSETGFINIYSKPWESLLIAQKPALSGDPPRRLPGYNSQ